MVDGSLIKGVLVTVNLVGFTSLLYISYKLYGISRLLGSSLDPALAFLLLSLSQLAGALVPLTWGRASFTLYVASGVLTASSFAIMLYTTLGSSRTAQVIPPALAIPLVSDISALVFSALGLTRFSGAARILSAGYTAAFILRLAAILTLPSQESFLLLTMGEAARSVASALAAVYYVISSRR